MAPSRASSIRRRIAEIRHLPGTPRHLRPVMITRGLISRAEAQLLYGLARDVAAGVIVEVGSYRGRSTAALALGSQAGNKVPVYAVEPHETFQDHDGSPRFGPLDRAAFYRTMLRTRGFRLVHLVNLSSEELSPGWSRPVGLLWIDGDHSPSAVRRDFASWRPHLLAGAPVVFDDAIEPSSGPGQVIAEEIAAGHLIADRSVGKVRVLRCTHAVPDAGLSPAPA